MLSFSLANRRDECDDQVGHFPLSIVQVCFPSLEHLKRANDVPSQLLESSEKRCHVNELSKTINKKQSNSSNLHSSMPKLP